MRGARRFTPAGFFNWIERLSLSRCSASRGADLCEHREHVEVVRGALDLTALDLDDLACRHLDRLVRCRNGTCWCLQWPGVNALPHELEDRGVPARELAHEGGLGVGEGLRPALPGLDDRADAVYDEKGTHRRIQGAGSQHIL